MKKILWVKFGWSDYYQGGTVGGDFPWLAEHGGKGHEAWNFKPADGRYYCYVPPQGAGGTPWNPDPRGWTVVCLARYPRKTGIHVVGWYEDATLHGGYRNRPEAGVAGPAAQDGKTGDLLYSISAGRAFLVPPELRVSPFSHESVRQGKYSFLDGPGVAQDANKRAVLKILEADLKRLKSTATSKPNPATASIVANDEADPLRSFGTAEHRKKVEKRAVEAATEKLEAMGYCCNSREPENLGFDLEATHRVTKKKMDVEVKGTASPAPRLFMTANEHAYMSKQTWRLAMVTNALTKPEVELLDRRQFDKTFKLTPMVWVGREILET